MVWTFSYWDLRVKLFWRSSYSVGTNAVTGDIDGRTNGQTNTRTHRHLKPLSRYGMWNKIWIMMPLFQKMRNGTRNYPPFLNRQKTDDKNSFTIKIFFAVTDIPLPMHSAKSMNYARNLYLKHNLSV